MQAEGKIAARENANGREYQAQASKVF